MAIEDMREVLCQQLRGRIPYSEFPELAGNDRDMVRFEFLEEIEHKSQRWIVARMRAFQGHSFKGLETGAGKTLMTVKNAPEQLIHGTYARHIDSVIKEGLVPGGKTRGTRNENHFATVEAAWDHRIPI